MGPLKVLIVDDDMAMRTSLKTMLDWERQGFVICGEAVNGANAVQIIEKNTPDIVITDMSMPVMDGVALIGYLGEKQPRIKIIALSGYDDFDYVRQSMKKGAVDYILKHKLDPKLLADVLEVTRQSILEGMKELDERQQAREKLDSARGILRREFVKSLIMGEFTETKKIERELGYLNIGMDLKNLVVAAVEIDDYSFIEDNYPVKERNKLINTFADISRSILDEGGKALMEHVDKGNFVVVFSFGNAYSSMYVYNRIISDIDRIKTSLKRYLNITASFGVSKVCFNVLDISSYYAEAKAILKDKFYQGKDRIFSGSNVEKAEENYFTLDFKDEKKIRLLVKSLEKQELNSFIKSIFDRMQKNKASHPSVQMITAELINIAGKAARESGIDLSGFFPGKGAPYSMLQKYDTVADISRWVLNIFDGLADEMKNRTSGSGCSEITKKAIEFIHRHYQDNISLNDAAGYAGANNSYLSHVFKENTGKGFVEYLNTFRIEKAKILIGNGDARIKDMVGELGFNNYNYFFKVFKEYVGMTPMEYEESLKKGG